jgi:XTP/dITP diphosphohydrolase
MEILFATSNIEKAKELQSVLQRPVQHIKIDLPELQTLEVNDVIEHKAREAFRQVGKPILVEDTSLSIIAWNGLPGALIRWFLKSVGNTGICRMMQNFENSEAIAEVCIGYFDGAQFHAFHGVIHGRITRIPRGTMGFGWDPIFAPVGSDKTFAEMTPEEKESFSMRKQAALKLKQFLDENNFRTF